MNVVIYARYSSHNQTEQSIEGQLKVCYEYAKRNDYTIIGEYIDRALSGTNDNRPEFQKMIEDSSKKLFQGILVYQLDRFSRNRYDSAINKNKLKKNGVRVFSARENISEDASGILMESVLEGMAEYYSAELAQKVKRGMSINASNCLYNGCPIPLGLKVENKKYQIDEEKAHIIKKIFDMYIEGHTMAEIIRYLNEQQIKTSSGNEFNKNSIRNILLNKKYIGIYSYDGQETKDGIPRIIDDNTFSKAQEKMLKNKQAPARARAKTEYILTTKLFCGHCKEMMVGGGGGTSHTGKYYKKYSCKGAMGGKCHKHNISKEYIEGLVIEKARDFLTDENIEKIAKNIVGLIKKEKDMSNMRRLEKLLKENEKQKDNLFDSIKLCYDDSVKKDMFEEISKMNKQKIEIENQIRIEETINVKVTVQQIRLFLKNIRKGKISDIRYRKMLIDVLIYKVYLYDDNITIVFSTQDKHYEEKIPTISELESSFMGNNVSPIKAYFLIFLNI